MADVILRGPSDVVLDGIGLTTPTLPLDRRMVVMLMRMRSESRDAELTSLRGIRVLLADDNAFNREFFEVVMAGRGLDIVLASDGAEALEALTTEAFDLAFIDIQMPVMDGLAATRAARERGVDLPIIALTANVTVEEIEACLAAGMNTHLAKPYTAQAVVGMIVQWRS